MGDEEEEPQKKGNALPLWGNQQTMNINNLVVTNILSSPYFKNDLFKIKTFHEVIDEIYYKVEHLEPWEKGSRKIRGQVGMCGGVRGVGTGGIVSSTFCLLFKLFTLKLTEKQVYTLINHTDSPYIRGLGFMFIRFCQHPNTYWDWFEPYLEDEEEVDPKAGGGSMMTMGQMVRSFLLKPDWYGTLFPRIPVPIFKEIEAGLKELNLNDDRKVYADEDNHRSGAGGGSAHHATPSQDEAKRNRDQDGEVSFGEAERYAAKKREERKSGAHADNSNSRHRDDDSKSKNSSRHHRGGSRDNKDDKNKQHDRHRSDEKSRGRSRDDSRDKRGSSRDRSRDRKHRKDRSKERSHQRGGSQDRGSSPHRSSHGRHRSRSRDRKR